MICIFTFHCAPQAPGFVEPKLCQEEESDTCLLLTVKSSRYQRTQRFFCANLFAGLEVDGFSMTPVYGDPMSFPTMELERSHSFLNTQISFMWCRAWIGISKIPNTLPGCCPSGHTDLLQATLVSLSALCFPSFFRPLCLNFIYFF